MMFCVQNMPEVGCFHAPDKHIVLSGLPNPAQYDISCYDNTHHGGIVAYRNIMKRNFRTRITGAEFDL